MSDSKRRLTKEERDELRTSAANDFHVVHVGKTKFVEAWCAGWALGWVRQLLDDLDAANAEIEFEKGEVKRYWNACDAMENEIERLRTENKREKAKTRIMSTFAVDIAGARTSREFRLAEEKAMTALRALGEGRDDA